MPLRPIFGKAAYPQLLWRDPYQNSSYSTMVRHRKPKDNQRRNQRRSFPSADRSEPCAHAISYSPDHAPYKKKAHIIQSPNNSPTLAIGLRIGCHPLTVQLRKRGGGGLSRRAAKEERALQARWKEDVSGSQATSSPIYEAQCLQQQQQYHL